MPHRCAGCNTLFPDVRHLKDGCPVCGCGKFVFETGRRNTQTSERITHTGEHETVTGEDRQDTLNLAQEKEPVLKNFDSIESIKILEPGRYDLNLSRLAETDDRVVKVGSEDTYRLDLHSMIRQKKKK